MAAAIIVLASAPAVAETTYGGRGFGLLIDPATLAPLYSCDTGELPSTGGTMTDASANVSFSAGGQSITAGTLSCSTTASGTASHAVSDITNLQIALSVATVTANVTVTSIHSEALATCTGVSGNAVITGLMINGVCGFTTGAANEVVDIPGIGTLVVNEHIQVGAGEMTINALHLTLLDATEIVVAGTRAQISECSAVPVAQSSWGAIKALYR